LALPEHADQARTKLAELETARLVWVSGDKLADGDPGLTGESHRVVEEVVDGKVERRQLELREDPAAPYLQLGLAELKEAEEAAPETPPAPEEEVAHG
jgi:hypothetical protein